MIMDNELHRHGLRRPYQWSNTDDFSAMKVPFTSIQIPRRSMTYVLKIANACWFDPC